jgi:hypothetical protein
MDDDDEEAAVAGDDDIDAICESIRQGPTEEERLARKRVRGADNGFWKHPELVAFDELVQSNATRLRKLADGSGVENPRVNEILFWSQGLIGMTPLDAVEANRYDALARLIILDPESANAEIPIRKKGRMSSITLLRRAVDCWHWKCVEVLIRAGAKGAMKVVRDIIQSGLVLRALPYLLPGCDAGELRDWERERVTLGMTPIAYHIMEGMQPQEDVLSYFAVVQEGPNTNSGPWRRFESKYGAYSKGDGLQAKRRDRDEEKDSVFFTEDFLTTWLLKTRADDFRRPGKTFMGPSLQDDAAFLHRWTWLYKLQRRAVLTLLCIHRLTYGVNPEFCSIPRVVLRHLIVPLIYRPVYCPLCKKGVKANLICGGAGRPGCNNVMACSRCRVHSRGLLAGQPYLYPLCDKCDKPVCPACTNDCIAKPAMEDCRAVICSGCAPATCDDCIDYQIEMADHDDDDGDDNEDEEEMHSSSGEAAYPRHPVLLPDQVEGIARWDPEWASSSGESDDDDDDDDDDGDKEAKQTKPVDEQKEDDEEPSLALTTSSEARADAEISAAMADLEEFWRSRPPAPPPPAAE